MNTFAHIFLNYFVISLIIPNAREYLIPIIVFSTLLDLDHVQGFFKEMFMSKRKRKKLTLREHTLLVRSDVQEPIGIIIIELILGLLYVFGIRETLLAVAALSIFLHWLLDFLTVTTAPSTPVDDGKVVKLYFEKKRNKVALRVFITLVFFVLFLIAYL